MMQHVLFRLTVVVLFAYPLAFGGCLGKGTVQPTKYYVLNSLYSSGEKIQPVADLKETTIGVGPLRLTQVLDRPQIVTRSSRNQIQVADFDRWAEPLQDNFSRVLADNLSILLTTERVIIFPWKSTTSITYQVAMEVNRFDGKPGEDVILRARWIIFGENDKKVLLKKQSILRHPLGSNDIAALVSAQSRLLANLSREIAEAIKTLSQKK